MSVNAITRQDVHAAIVGTMYEGLRMVCTKHSQPFSMQVYAAS